MAALPRRSLQRAICSSCEMYAAIAARQSAELLGDLQQMWLSDILPRCT